ncbi:MBL fold metallo-hydrolase [Chloroflexota bacterium]
MSNVEIYKLPYPACNCYLIKQDGLILIDAGPPNQVDRFLELLGEQAIEPQEISLMLMTHGHWDHIGSASDIKSLTGCEVAINYREKDWVEKALKPAPRGVGLWGSIGALMAKSMIARVTFPGVDVDLAVGDEDYNLEQWGVSGKVLYTPGHTSGSMSVLLDDGQAFIGDLAMSGFPMRIGPGMPPFAEDTNAIKESWKKLLDNGARYIYPAHGNPFSADVLAKAL